MKINRKLIDVLSEFDGCDGNETKLWSKFKNLSKYFFFGGYLTVNGRRRIFLRDIEFYYHEEEGRVKDYSMAHRNTKTTREEYLATGEINALPTGMKISFENKEKQYRAAMLIRGFSVVEPGEEMTEKYDAYPTHLYQEIFRGLTLQDGIHLEWVEDPLSVDEGQMKSTFRYNVPEFDFNGNRMEKDATCVSASDVTANKRYKQDKRLWRFIREI